MEQITIARIEIENFKGIAKLHKDLNKGLNRIYGVNGTGKSTLKNAWEWCLCQTIEDYLPMIDNKEIPNLKTSVTVYIHIGDSEYGMDYKLTRESRPKYSQSRGKSNELSYKIDDIELTKTVYVERISQILGAKAFENLPLLTDKEYFNTDTTKWKWNNRRMLLLNNCDIEEKCNSLIDKADYKDIKPYILKGFQTSEIQSTILKEKKDLKKQQEENVTRISDKHEEINEYLGIDFDKLQKELATAKTRLTKLANSSEKQNVSRETMDISNKIAELATEIDRLKATDALTLKQLKSELVKLFEIAYNDKVEYERYKAIIDTANKQIQKAEEDQTFCPHCNKPLVDITALKSGLLGNEEDVVNKLNNLKATMEKSEQTYRKQQLKIDNFAENPHINELESSISALKTQLDELGNKNATELLENSKIELAETISKLESELAKKQFIDKGTAQIKLWKDTNLEIADKLIEIENKEMQLQSFVKEQTELISKVVNDKFGEGISWSLFTENYNGSIEQDCICLYNNKRYTSLSTGEKNKANMEVVKFLQNMFEVKLPIFSDNAETMNIPYTADTQVIELYASIPVDKKEQDFDTLNAIKITDLY